MPGQALFSIHWITPVDGVLIAAEGFEHGAMAFVGHHLRLARVLLGGCRGP